MGRGNREFTAKKTAPKKKPSYHPSLFKLGGAKSTRKTETEKQLALYLLKKETERHEKAEKIYHKKVHKRAELGQDPQKDIFNIFRGAKKISKEQILFSTKMVRLHFFISKLIGELVEKQGIVVDVVHFNKKKCEEQGIVWVGRGDVLDAVYLDGRPEFDLLSAKTILKVKKALLDGELIAMKADDPDLPSVVKHWEMKNAKYGTRSDRASQKAAAREKKIQAGEKA